MRRSKQDLIEIMITACEGGINYWANVKNYQPDKGQATVIDCGEQDYSDGRSRYFEIDSKVIRKGLNLMLNSENEFWRKTAVSDCLDACDSDMIIQFGLFGELIYG